MDAGSSRLRGLQARSSARTVVVQRDRLGMGKGGAGGGVLSILCFGVGVDGVDMDKVGIVGDSLGTYVAWMWEACVWAVVDGVDEADVGKAR